MDTNQYLNLLYNQLNNNDSYITHTNCVSSYNVDYVNNDTYTRLYNDLSKYR